MDVGDSLEEQQRKHVILEIRSINRPSQNIGRLPEVRFQLREHD